MRWTGLLLAVACSHTQPPPAPLSVPSENAAGPANLPDGGPADGGTFSSDAGVPRADLISPITIPGRETPVGLDWGETGKRPAGTIFKNVKLLGAVSADRFMAAMQSMQASLGRKCVLCHLVEQKDFPSDAEKEFAADTPKKTRAREMLDMTSYIAKGYYGNDSPVGCGTCHRGKPIPARTAAEKS